MTRVRALSLAATMIPLAAFANYSMSAGEELFSGPGWLAYVLISIALEAFVIGRWLGVRFRRAIVISVLANVASALVGCCPLCCGFGIPALHLVRGPDTSTIFLVLQFIGGAALISALVEAAVWEYATLKTTALAAYWRPLGATLVAHAVGIPIALACVYAPEHPFGDAQPLERTRASVLGSELTAYVRKHHAVPPGFNIDMAVTAMESDLNNGDVDLVDTDIGYVPDWRRFDTKEMRRRPRQWNASVAGLKLDKLPKGKVWLVRWTRPSDGKVGEISIQDGQVKYQRRRY